MANLELTSLTEEERNRGQTVIAAIQAKHPMLSGTQLDRLPGKELACVRQAMVIGEEAIQVAVLSIIEESDESDVVVVTPMAILIDETLRDLLVNAGYEGGVM